VIYDIYIYIYIYLLTAIGLSPGDSIKVHIYTQTVHRTTQIKNNLEECGPCPIFANFTLVFALHLRKEHGKTSVSVQCKYYQKNPHIYGGSVILISCSEATSVNTSHQLVEPTLYLGHLLISAFPCSLPMVFLPVYLSRCQFKQ